MPNARELDLILQAWKQPEIDGIDEDKQPPWGRGCLYQRDRLQVIAMLCARDCPGDLVEIGCLGGAMTVRLADVAKMYNRRVIAVDPWEIGTQNCSGGEYESFLETTKPYKNIIDVVRLSSLDEEAIRYIKERELCFAYIDGLHQYSSCVSDIQTCWHSPVLVVDDYAWEPDIARAVSDTIGTRYRIEVKPLHELYII